MEIVLGLVVFALFGIIVFQQIQIMKLIDKLMSRNYEDYSKARILEKQVAAEIEAIKSRALEEDFK